MTQLKRKTTYTYKLFRVKNRDGKSTTVSVDPIVVAAAIKVLGDRKTVGQCIREASLHYSKGDDGCSRSRFVHRQLLAHIHAAKRSPD